MIYQQSYDHLFRACQQMLHHRQRFAKGTIEQHVLQHVGTGTSNEALMSHIVAESILKRLDRHLVESKNIYIEEFDIPQIVMFYKMAQAYPHIFVSHDLANQYLVWALQGQGEATLFEIGIGQGKQVGRMLQRAAQEVEGLERLHVVALDPNPQNLQDAGEHLRSLEAELPFVLSYHPIQGLLENFTEADYDVIRGQQQGALLINSAYTIHHTSHPLGDEDARTDLFHALAKLSPRIITLIEPNSNHDTESLSERFKHCWHHFGTVFELIDESALAPEERFSIKEKFFGREIRDIFGVSDHFRCERHEPYESWLLRLAKSKWLPVSHRDLQLTLPSYCQSQISDGIVRLGYKDITLIAVLAYTTDPSLGVAS